MGSLTNKPSSSLPSQINREDALILNKTEICDAFNCHFINSGNLFDRMYDGVSMENLTPENFPESSHRLCPPDITFSIRPVSHTEVFNALLSSSKFWILIFYNLALP